MVRRTKFENEEVPVEINKRMCYEIADKSAYLVLLLIAKAVE